MVTAAFIFSLDNLSSLQYAYSVVEATLARVESSWARIQILEKLKKKNYPIDPKNKNERTHLFSSDQESRPCSAGRCVMLLLSPQVIIHSRGLSHTCLQLLFFYFLNAGTWNKDHAVALAEAEEVRVGIRTWWIHATARNERVCHSNRVSYIYYKVQQLAILLIFLHFTPFTLTVTLTAPLPWPWL